MSTYLVTGATGVIGSALVPLLLADGDACVTLLIRARSEAHLTDRLARLRVFWGYGDDAQPALRRISAIRGDIAQPDFGMESGEYARLSEQCTHIVHSAGNVRMNLSLDEARRTAVDSARNVVALADRCEHHGQLEKVEFVSTVGVCGRNAGIAEEAWITNDRDFHNTYEAAKAEAESYMRGHIDRGLPVTVHRPSMVVGDSTTGKVIHFQIFYHLCEFLSGRRTRGVFPTLGNACLDTVPVDYAARAIAWSSTQQSTAGQILHLCSGPREAIPLETLRDRVRQAFQASGEVLPGSLSVPEGVLRACLPVIRMFAPAHLRPALRSLPLFLEYLAEEQGFANERSKALLSTAGIELPAVDSYLGTVLRYYLERTTAA